jgi:hypothetical protein
MINPNTQAGRLLTHLQSGQSINRLDALIKLGIFELSARVIDIESNGYIITKSRKTITNQFNEKTSVTVYNLVSEFKAAA